MANNTFTLNSLEAQTPASTDFFLKSDTSGNYRKTSLSQIINAVTDSAFGVTDTDITQYVNAKFSASRARMKKMGNYVVWLSIQVTVATDFNEPYGQNIVTFGNDVAPAPAYTAELCGYNVTRDKAVRVYKSGASISIAGSGAVGDIITIGGCYII